MAIGARRGRRELRAGNDRLSLRRSAPARICRAAATPVSFLAPAFLLLAAAAAIPLLVHLLRRRMEQRIDFPAARYLARAERENSRKLRLRNLLLMMLRVLAVLLVALAAARPVGRLAGTGHAPTAVALVIDNGLSSSAIHDGRAILEGLKDAARRVVAASKSTDQLWLITA